MQIRTARTNTIDVRLKVYLHKCSPAGLPQPGCRKANLTPSQKVDLSQSLDFLVLYVTFSLTSEIGKVTSCPAGKAPIRDEAVGNHREVLFGVGDCLGCPKREECPIKSVREGYGFSYDKKQVKMARRRGGIGASENVLLSSPCLHAAFWSMVRRWFIASAPRDPKWPLLAARTI